MMTDEQLEIVRADAEKYGGTLILALIDRLEAAEAVCAITTNPLYSTDDHQDHERMLAALASWRKAKGEP